MPDAPSSAPRNARNCRVKIEGNRDLKAPAERVYHALTDPEILCRTIPGCQRLSPVGDNAYEAVLSAGVGPVKGTFSGNVRLEDTRPPSHYRIVFEGKGAPGFVKGSADFDLQGNGEATALRYVADLNLGGPIAGVGQRLIQATAQMMVSRFFSQLEKNW